MKHKPVSGITLRADCSSSLRFDFMRSLNLRHSINSGIQTSSLANLPMFYS